MAAPKDMNTDSALARYIFMQHREGVSLTLNVFADENPKALIEEYEMFLEQIRDFPGYAVKKKKDEEYERGRRRGAAARGRY
jgi:hypothetical protein